MIGSRDLAQLIARHAKSSLQHEIVGFFDDFRSAGEETATGPILGKIADLANAYRQGVIDCFLLGIGYGNMGFRAKCFSKARESVPPATLIHPSCYVDPSAQVMEGCVLFPGCLLDANVTIRANTVLNVGCVLAHDSTVHQNCFFGPGVNVSGYSSIGSGCFIGAGTTVIEKLKVCAGVQTGAGAVITKSITEPGLYVGVPAIKKR